ncbi:MAG: hypothetical protein KIT22_01995 [Verrucomicrobiae bacterium]|nr:hypothetical protein [Verrucomicrobiae bacterium]
MKYLSLLCVALIGIVIAMTPAGAQYNPISEGVSVNPTNARLMRPLIFFEANQDLIVAAIGSNNFGVPPDALIIRPALSNATVVGTLTSAAGSQITADRLVLTGDIGSLTPSNAVPLALLDQRATRVVANLTQLVSQDHMSSAAYQNFIVLSDTDGDGSAGDWLWHPYSLAAESAVIKKLASKTLSDPGRFFQR